MTGSLESGWRTLRGSADRVLVPTLVLGTAGIALHVVLQHLSGTVAPGTDENTLMLSIFALYVVGQLVVAGLYRAALDAVDDVPVRGPFTGWFSGRVVRGALLAAALLTVSTVVLIVPALLVGFLVRYAPLFVLDRGLGPVAAVVASTRFVVSDLGAELWFAVRAAALLLAGALLLGLGLYLAVPVVLLAQTQRFRMRVDGV